MCELFFENVGKILFPQVCGEHLTEEVLVRELLCDGEGDKDNGNPRPAATCAKKTEVQRNRRIMHDSHCQ